MKNTRYDKEFEEISAVTNTVIKNENSSFEDCLQCGLALAKFFSKRISNNAKIFAYLDKLEKE